MSKGLDHYDLERYFPGLFHIVHEDNKIIYYLQDTSITLDPFYLTNNPNNSNGVVRCEFINSNSDIEIRLNLYLNDGKISNMASYGQLILPGDILSEESCVKMFELNIEIYWECYSNGIGRDYDTYDREAIMRRHTIRKIIE